MTEQILLWYVFIVHSDGSSAPPPRICKRRGLVHFFAHWRQPWRNRRLKLTYVLGPYPYAKHPITKIVHGGGALKPDGYVKKSNLRALKALWAFVQQKNGSGLGSVLHIWKSSHKTVVISYCNDRKEMCLQPPMLWSVASKSKPLQLGSSLKLTLRIRSGM